jgi:hypothetical protein
VNGNLPFQALAPVAVTAWRLKWVSDCAWTIAGTAHIAKTAPVNGTTDFNDIIFPFQNKAP